MNVKTVIVSLFNINDSNVAYSGLYRSGHWLIAAIRDAPAVGPLLSSELL